MKKKRRRISDFMKLELKEGEELIRYSNLVGVKRPGQRYIEFYSDMEVLWDPLVDGEYSKNSKEKLLPTDVDNFFIPDVRGKCEKRRGNK